MRIRFARCVLRSRTGRVSARALKRRSMTLLCPLMLLISLSVGLACGRHAFAGVHPSSPLQALRVSDPLGIYDSQKRKTLVGCVSESSLAVGFPACYSARSTLPSFVASISGIA